MADDTIGPEPLRTDPEYKMSIGQRILGAANNFLQGMAHHPAVTNTGRGAVDEGKLAEAHSKWNALEEARKETAKGSAAAAAGTGAGMAGAGAGAFGTGVSGVLNADEGTGERRGREWGRQ